MQLNQDYLKLMAQKIVKHRDNWKDNPNRFTSLFLICTPIFNPKQRTDFNERLTEFTKQNKNIRPEIAEKICFSFHNPMMYGQKLFINMRIKSEYGTFDVLRREYVDVTKLERGLRNLALWCLITFKEICTEQGLKFDQDELGISDIQQGATAIL